MNGGVYEGGQGPEGAAAPYMGGIRCVQSQSATFTNVFTYSYRGSHASATRHHQTAPLVITINT